MAYWANTLTVQQVANSYCTFDLLNSLYVWSHSNAFCCRVSNSRETETVNTYSNLWVSLDWVHEWRKFMVELKGNWLASDSVFNICSYICYSKLLQLFGTAFQCTCLGNLVKNGADTEWGISWKSLVCFFITVMTLSALCAWFELLLSLQVQEVMEVSIATPGPSMLNPYWNTSCSFHWLALFIFVVLFGFSLKLGLVSFRRNFLLYL